MTLKNIMAGLFLSAAAMASMAVPAFANQVTEDDAKETAMKYLPKDSRLQKIENKWDKYEMKFYSESHGEEYELDLSKNTNKLLNFESEHLNSRGSSTVNITNEQAKNIVTGELKGVEITSSYLAWDDGLRQYNVYFRGEGLYGKYVINPKTGKIIERDVTFTRNATDFGSMTPEQATDKILEKIPGSATVKALKDDAMQYLPKDSILRDIHNKSDKYELKFYSQSYAEKYEVEYSKTTQKMLSFESERFNDRGGASVTLSEAAAKQAVTNELKNVNITSCYLEWDISLRVYEVHFENSSLYGKYIIHPQTGAVLERDITFIQTVDTQPETKPETKPEIKPTQKPDTKPTPSTQITMEEAKQIALDKVPGAVVQKIKLDREDGRLVYEGELRKGKMEYDFEIDANTGIITDWDADYDD